jgi:hypothetical protein
MTFSIGDNVQRIEDRPEVAAVVVATVIGSDYQVLELAYIEGGSGWWPANAVVKSDA